MNHKYKKQCGFSTLEILIAFFILTISTTAVILIVFGNQSSSTSSQTNGEALYQAQHILEDARASSSHADFLDIVSVLPASVSNDIYNREIKVLDISPCAKQVTGVISWKESIRSLGASLSTLLTDPEEAIALGGDCALSPPGPKWDNPQRFSGDTLSPGKTTTVDVLNKIVYLGGDHSPFFYIANTKNATLCTSNSCGLLVTFDNGFMASVQINSLEAIRDPTTGKNYVFAAMHSTSNQLAVIDVSDIHNPILAAARSLSPCVTSTDPSMPQTGWRLRYYSGKLYLTTRYTAGPEFHIFDVANPANPTEYALGSVACKGFELGDTVNDLTVRDQSIAGITKRFVYLATDESDKELKVLDVTDPFSVSEVNAANQNLPGIQNGLSVYISGNKLYLGRQSSSGPDLYVYDTSNPPIGLTLLGLQDIGPNTGVVGIRIAGKFAFLATTKTSEEFQVWDISSFSTITLIKKYNFGNIVNQGLDYEPDFIYATGNATPNFQILYSP